MGQISDGSRGDAEFIKRRVQELTWAALDDVITSDEIPLLESLLLSDDTARSTYLNCVQMHSDLFSYFASPSTKSSETAGNSAQVLGHLHPGPFFDFQAPAGDQALQ